MSDWKESSAKRRDIRNTKVSDEIQTASNKKKNTKRWCKGKVGKEHTALCMTYDEAKKGVGAVGKVFARARYLVCTTCGKEISIYYGFKNEKKPDWVDK